MGVINTVKTMSDYLLTLPGPSPDSLSHPHDSSSRGLVAVRDSQLVPVTLDSLYPLCLNTELIRLGERLRQPSHLGELVDTTEGHRGWQRTSNEQHFFLLFYCLRVKINVRQKCTRHSVATNAVSREGYQRTRMCSCSFSSSSTTYIVSSTSPRTRLQ